MNRDHYIIIVYCLVCVNLHYGRPLSGAWVDRLTGINGAEIRVRHLRLPGCGDEGPTLEIIRYNHAEAAQATAPNRPGFGHIAFAVEVAKAAHEAVLAAGGGAIGVADLPGRRRLTAIYATDPEGNIIELQRWD